MRIHHYYSEDCTEQLLKAKVQGLGKWQMEDRQLLLPPQKVLHMFFLLGILVQSKLPLTMHFCRYPYLHSVMHECLRVCVRTWISLGYLLGESSVDFRAGDLVVGKDLC